MFESKLISESLLPLSQMCSDYCTLSLVQYITTASHFHVCRYYKGLLGTPDK